MEWQDLGLFLHARRHGERGLIVHTLTSQNGRQAGYYYKKKSSPLHAGALIQIRWQGRFKDQLGTFQIEMVEDIFPQIMHHPLALQTLLALTHLLMKALPEGHAYPHLWHDTRTLLAQLKIPDAPLKLGASYILWEARLLECIGFGLDFSGCPMTLQTEDLRYISPKTGRAVSAQAALPYFDKLLRLPAFLRDPGAVVTAADLLDGFKLNSHFIQHHANLDADSEALQQRHRLMEMFMHIA